MCKDFIKKHIFFSNDLSDDPVKAQKRKDLYTDMIAQIISESLFFFQDDYYNADISTFHRFLSNSQVASYLPGPVFVRTGVSSGTRMEMGTFTSTPSL